MRKLILLLLACWVAVGMVRAQSLDKEMSALAASLSKELVTQGSKNVAVVDFTDLQGQPTELGRFLSEQLAVEIVLTKGVSVLDRANFKSILAEHKLTEQGLVNPANAKKLGEFAGVDTILIGTVTALDAGFVLTVKAISTESAKIIAAGRATFTKTPDLQGIANTNLTGSAASGSDSGAGYKEANAIATKDLGSLRVVLKSVLPAQVKDAQGSVSSGLRISFDFTSRETQRPIVVGMNATEALTFPCRLGNGLRSSLVDSNGNYWSYSSVTGVGIIGVGCVGYSPSHKPSEIVSLLQEQDRRGPKSPVTSSGAQSASGAAGAAAAGAAAAAAAIRAGQGSGQPGNQSEYVYGSMSVINPGQTISVTMTFVLDGNGQDRSPQYFQINSEIIVGIVTADKSKSYSLQNLTFDQVRPPGIGGIGISTNPNGLILGNINIR